MPRDPSFSILYADLKAGKCLAESEEIPLSDGRLVPVGDLARAGTPAEVLALDSAMRVRPAAVRRFYDNGMKPIVRVETADGRRIRVTPNHPLLTERGWMPAEEIPPGTLLAVPRSLPFFGMEQMSTGAIKFLAYMLADGALDNGSIRVTEGNAEKVEDLRRALDAFPDVELRRSGEDITYRVVRQDRKTSSAHRFLRKCGLDGKHAATKAVPSFVFALDRALISLFLSRYLGCDGAVHTDGTISFSSASERMARQIAHLLLRFGAFGRLRTKIVKGTPYFEWVAADIEATEAIRLNIGVFTKPIAPRTRDAVSKHDRLPVRWGDVPKSEWGAVRRPRSAYVTRGIARRLDSDHLRVLANSDLRWEKVKSITSDGTERTFDLVVPIHHNFVASDVIAHNTADALAAFPGATYIAAPGALAPADSVWGFEQPKAHDLQTFKDIRAFAEKLVASSTPALVVDDATLIADRTGIYYRDEKGLSGWDVWGAVLNSAIKLRDTLRRKGIHIVFTCHEAGAYIEEGVRRKGGPAFQGQCKKKIPAAADLLLRAEARTTGFGWPMCYRTSPHPDWLQGSRYDTPDMAPMNLGEILRLAGFAIPRLKGLEWQERLAHALANELLAPPGLGVAEKVKERLAQAHEGALKHFSRNKKHVMWAIRDGYDRAVLRAASAGARLSLWGF